MGLAAPGGLKNGHMDISWSIRRKRSNKKSATYTIRKDGAVIAIEHTRYEILGAALKDLLLGSRLIEHSIEAEPDILDFLRSWAKERALIADHGRAFGWIKDENSRVESFDDSAHASRRPYIRCRGAVAIVAAGTGGEGARTRKRDRLAGWLELGELLVAQRPHSDCDIDGVHGEYAAMYLVPCEAGIVFVCWLADVTTV